MPAPSINGNSPITSFTHADNVSNDIRALTFLSKWGGQGVGSGATVYFSFPSATGQSSFGSGYSTEPTNDPNAILFRAYYPSEVQINAARLVFQQWANVANLNFVEVPVESPNSVGDIRIFNFTIENLPPDNFAPYAFAIPPMASDSTGISGDIWFNKDLPYDSASEYAIGANGYQVMLHEMGHALGLSHPFLDGHDHEVGEVALDPSKDHFQYTIMSYSDVAWSDYFTYPDFFPTTPMLLDIQAMQYLYGANTSYQTGNNAYTYGEAHAYETIWDAGGLDTIKNNGGLNSVINLNAGEFSSIGPSVKAHRAVGVLEQNNIAIAYDVTIENAFGGSGNDIIYGNDVSNIIDGGAGFDTFITALSRGDITSIILRDNGEILLSSAYEQDALTQVEMVNFSDGEYTIDSLLLDATSVPEFTKHSNAGLAISLPEKYSGPVSYLQFQLLGSNDGEIIYGADTNDFVTLLGGDDAAQGNGGNDVLDGGTGSNFLAGGAGTDVFFVDGRGGETTWSTITDFNNDSVTIWGWVAGTSQMMSEVRDGVEGYQGITLHLDLNGDNNIDTSITFTGLTGIDVANRKADSIEGNGYLSIIAS